MRARSPSTVLARRERQIMDILYRLDRATAAGVRKEMEAPPSYSGVRALLRILEHKGYVHHMSDGPRDVYEPTSPRANERVSALRHVVRTFFAGSTQDAVLALLDASDSRLGKKQLDDLARRILAAKGEGR